MIPSPDTVDLKNLSNSEYLQTYGPGRLPINALVVPEVAEYLPDGSSVRLVNGTVVRGIDRVILGTGYVRKLSFTEPIGKSDCCYRLAPSPSYPASTPIKTPSIRLSQTALTFRTCTSTHSIFLTPPSRLPIVSGLQCFTSFSPSSLIISLQRIYVSLDPSGSPSIRRQPPPKCGVEQPVYLQKARSGKTTNSSTRIGFLEKSSTTLIRTAQTVSYCLVVTVRRLIRKLSPDLVRRFVGWLNYDASFLGGSQIDGYPANVWEETKNFFAATYVRAVPERNTTLSAFSLSDEAVAEGLGE